MHCENRVRVEGAAAAELYQTYGVPPELFESLAAEHNLTFDWEGYARAMEAHGEVSGKVQHTVMGAKGPIDSLKHALHSTEFLGYETTEAEAVVRGIIAGTPPRGSPLRLDAGDRPRAAGTRGARSYPVLRREWWAGGRPGANRGRRF